MKRERITLLLLAASLIANACFVGGYLYVRHQARELRRPAKRIEAVARRFHLNRSQKRLLVRLKKEARRIRRRYHRRSVDQRQRLWPLLAGPASSREEADRIIEQMAQDRSAYQKKIIGIIRRFMNALDPDQRHRFLKMLTGNNRLSALLLG